MSKLDIAEGQVTEDNNEELTFRLGPSVVHSAPVQVPPGPLVVPSVPGEPTAPKGSAEGTPVATLGPAETPVISLEPAEEAPKKEPMKIVKLRVPASIHAQILALMESLGCANESQIYRQVIYTGLKHTKRSR